MALIPALYSPSTRTDHYANERIMSLGKRRVRQFVGRRRGQKNWKFLLIGFKHFFCRNQNGKLEIIQISLCLIYRQPVELRLSHGRLGPLAAQCYWQPASGRREPKIGRLRYAAFAGERAVIRS